MPNNKSTTLKLHTNIHKSKNNIRYDDKKWSDAYGLREEIGHRVIDNKDAQAKK
jgi:hypothetical protein